MFELNEKIVNLTPYEPISGSYKIRLDANESFLNPDCELMAAIESEIKSIPFNRYPDPLALRLCEGFASYYNVEPSLVCAGNGSDELISIIMNAFLQKGDTVLTFSPDFSMYSFYSDISEANCITLPKKNYRIDIDEAIRIANEKQVRIIVFSNPCNPTSICMEKSDVIRLIEETNALVVADEAYMDFASGSVIDCVAKYDNLLVLKTCSKAFGMAAIRLGFAVGSLKLINALKAVKSPYNVNSITQSIGCALFSMPQKLNDGILKICASRDSLLSEIKSICSLYPERIKLISADANFLAVETTEARDIFNYLKENKIIVRCFDNMLRLTAGESLENKELVSALKNYFSL